MKRFILFSILLAIVNDSIAQSLKYDSLKIYDVILTKSTKNGKLIYSANETEINKKLYDSIERESYTLCKPLLGLTQHTQQ